MLGCTKEESNAGILDCNGQAQKKRKPNLHRNVPGNTVNRKKNISKNRRIKKSAQEGRVTHVFEDSKGVKAEGLGPGVCKRGPARNTGRELFVGRPIIAHGMDVWMKW